MRNWMETKVPRRLLSLALSAAMVLSLLPVFAFAEETDGLCQHHPAHTPECGYVAAVEGQDCTHVCGDACYTVTTDCKHNHDESCYSDGVLPNQGEEKTADACTHVCSEESGCVTKTHACVHTAHDETCGYVQAVAGQPCSFVCTECAGGAQPEAACSLTQGCILTNGHEGPCIAAPAHGCDGTLVPVEGDEGEQLWRCPVCGALLDAQGNELPAVRTYGSTSGTFNGSPAEVDADGSLLINDTNFPDDTFREFVKQYDKDSSGSLSEEEVAAVTGIDCDDSGIGSLKGIEYFTSLTQLDCRHNQLTELDVSENKALTQLDCGYNQLTELDVRENKALTELACSSNQLTKLDVSETLTILYCGSNQLTELDVRENKALTELNCHGNQLTELDVSENKALTSLYCGSNQLTELDVSKHTALTELACSSNQLTSLNVSGNTALTRLACQNNKLAALDLTGLSIGERDVKGQTPDAVLSLRDGKLTVDLGSLVGTENLSRVQSLTGGTMDSDGIVTIPIPSDPTADIQVSYQYDTRMNYTQLLPVTLTHKHSFDENGDCACGLVKQVPYVDAQGNSLGTQVCTILTGDATTLTAGWYVASGSVTIGTEEAPNRVTVSGDVNLILEDGCDLIVNGGIQVQDNSTDSTPNTNALTIYAQSTAETTMGKLTAQNVDFNAAIGGSDSGGSGGEITINGGIVKAESNWGAAIGGGGISDGIGGSGGKITINGGIVKAESNWGAAIGGGGGLDGHGGSGGTITINGGIIQAESEVGAAIGGGGGGLGGDGGSGGEITITGGNVTATSNTGAAIGGGGGDGAGGIGGEITISGGIVQAESGGGAAIGGGYGSGSGGSGTFSTGTNGNAVIFASSISDKSSQSSWSGVIFEGAAGKVYGSPTLSLGLPIPKDKSLTLDMDGNSLTFAGSTGITLNSGSTLTLSGPGSFPGGISVSGGTLADLLAEGWAFRQNGSWVYDNTLSALTGSVALARITVTITGQPADVSVTYGDTASLSVTAVPTTSGSTVTYQWYLDGEALAGQTQSTLSLSGLYAGSYQVSCAVTCDGFTVNSVTAAVTVGQAAGTVTITGNPGKTYDGQPAALTADGYTVTGDGTVTVEYKGKDAADTAYASDAPTNAGDYTVRVTQAAGTNYAKAEQTADFTIRPKAVTAVVTVTPKTYDGATNAAVSAEVTEGLISGDTMTITGLTGTFVDANAGTDKTVAVNAANMSITGTGASNYAVTIPNTATGTITKAQAVITVEAEKNAYSKTYGDAPFQLEGITENSNDADVQYAVTDGTDVVSVSESGTVTILKAGEATITLSLPESANYLAAQSMGIYIDVAKAASSVTITGDPGKTYDGLPAMLNPDMYTATGGAVKVEYKVKGADDSTYTMSAPKNAGDYTVRVTAEDANHTPASGTKDFTITPKEVTLTVTVKDKRFDNSVTAEIDTVSTNDFVSSDDVRVVNGTPTFARSTLGEQIPVSFTEFTLTGDDAGNYRLAQPTGVTGRILASASYLDLTNNPDFAGHTEVWVDGVSYPIQAEDGPYVSLPEEGGLLTIYTYQQGSAHEQYPTGMAVYRIDRQDTGATLEKIDAFDDLLQYSGCSIRVTGKRGIRMITSLTQGSKKALTGSGLAGYTLEEYGTVVQWADTLGSNSLTLATGKHNYAYKKGVADPVFATTDTLTQYTNVLVWESLTDAQLGQDIVMRPYIILRDGSGNTVTLYGGCVSRSIGYIAYQNRAVFNPGTAAYKYVWDIIHAVYGNQYNSEYKG